MMEYRTEPITWALVVAIEHGQNVRWWKVAGR